MFFEGSEKKIEIVVKSSVSELRSWPRSRWDSLVEAANAKILSSLSSSHCDSYLLSESSLFVWDDRIVLITCGETALVSAIKRFLTWVDPDLIDCLIFERKNEYHPHLQRTTFEKDARELKSLLPAKAFRFGNADEHHLFLLKLDRDYTPPTGDTTLELLMYDLEPAVQKILGTENQDPEVIRDLVNLDGALPGFQVDDYLFKPFGYSLNALRDECYYTMHITPQEEGSYVSFETNIPMDGHYMALVDHIIERFRPRTFDVVTFAENPVEFGKFDGFMLLNSVYDRLSCGYDVSYFNYVKPAREFGKPYIFK